MALFQFPALSLDTSMNACSVAVQTHADQPPISKSLPMPRGHAEALMGIILEVCAVANCELSALESIITTRGPGAFAGLRIGLATAQALAFSGSATLYALDTTRALFETARDSSPSWPAVAPIVIVMESKRSDFYVQVFSGGGDPITPASCMEGEDIYSRFGPDAVYIGDAVERFCEGLASALPHAHSLACPNVALFPRIIQKKTTDFLTTDPLYCKQADVSYPKLTIKTQEKAG